MSTLVHQCRRYFDGVYEPPHGHQAKELFDGIVFATSVMLLLSRYDPDILRLIGDTGLFLALAAAAGLAYSVRALWPPRSGRASNQ